ncbi:hypothetical protein D3C85_1282590 [compost metagenome]
MGRVVGVIVERVSDIDSQIQVGVGRVVRIGGVVGIVVERVRDIHGQVRRVIHVGRVVVARVSDIGRVVVERVAHAKVEIGVGGVVGIVVQ